MLPRGNTSSSISRATPSRRITPGSQTPTASAVRWPRPAPSTGASVGFTLSAIPAICELLPKWLPHRSRQELALNEYFIKQAKRRGHFPGDPRGRADRRCSRRTDRGHGTPHPKAVSPVQYLLTFQQGFGSGRREAIEDGAKRQDQRGFARRPVSGK